MTKLTKKSTLLNKIIKKLTSTNVTKLQLENVTDILHESRYLSKIALDLKKDQHESISEKEKAELKFDEFDVADQNTAQEGSETCNQKTY